MEQVTTVLLVVVVLIALIGTAVFMFFYIEDGEVFTPDEKTTVNLASPSVNTRDIANVTHWDTVININLVTPRDATVAWSDVVVMVRDADGQVLLQRTEALPDDPSSYDDAANGWVDVQVWYIDTDAVGVVGAGDAIKITGMDDRYEGGYVEVVDADEVERIGSITLPTNFP
jgi:hypothetical protein